MQDTITVKGARQHNLKNIDISIPKNKLVVFTGLSGSGKSSLAFDTIYAEGQRRYVESLSSYARQFLGIMNKPDVDQIDGLSPSISIDQKTTSHNPRSTVGTITEIYDYLRLLFARIGHPHCPNCGREIKTQSVDQIIDSIMNLIENRVHSSKIVRFQIQSPVIRDKKGEFQGLLDSIRKKGYQRVRIDGKVYDIDEDITLIKTNKHTISAIIDRFSLDKTQQNDKGAPTSLKSRLSQAIESATLMSAGLVTISFVNDPGFIFPDKPEQFEDHLFSENFACAHCNISLPEIEPRIFSFNSPHGACPNCSGLGTILKIDVQKLIAPELSLSEGAVIPFANMLSSDTWFSRKLQVVMDQHGSSMKTAWQELPPHIQQIVLHGDDKLYTVTGPNRQGRQATFQDTFEGIIDNLERRYIETQSDFMRAEIEKFMRKEICHTCNGTRLKPESLSVTIDGQNIASVVALPIRDCLQFVIHLKAKNVVSQRENQIGMLIIKEINIRLQFLQSVGLDYLTLNRESGTLAGGESQRIRLASQIGTGLTGVLYVLDEPSIGLHQKDNDRLIATLKNLRDLGNSVIVVEHDAEIMRQSDYIIDFGPKAGQNGGQVVFAGSYKDLCKAGTLTGQYVSGRKKVSIPTLPGNDSGKVLTLTHATKHNLQDITVDFPLGRCIVITGVSGSGKSTLIHDCLYQAIKEYLAYEKPSADAPYESLRGYENIDRVSLIDQSPIGRTPRSNPATYTKIFDYIRHLMANTKEASIRGYKAGRFSFNVKGGRCESCQGEGQVKIEMQFMPDVYITCEVCDGKRYNAETLEAHYKGKNIAEILHLTVDEAVEFFAGNLTLKNKLGTLQDVGLGYIELGQPAPTLSGGEAQRVKLAKELSIRSTGHCVYLLDEPTTGLHFEDVKNLMTVIKKLAGQGNTVIVIEHNLDVVKNADWIIDLGPDGGDKGGTVVFSGTLSALKKHPESYTAQYLFPDLK